VDSTFDSCSIDTGSNPAEAGLYVTTVGKFFAPSGAKGRLNQLPPGIAGTSIVTLGKLLPALAQVYSALIGG